MSTRLARPLLLAGLLAGGAAHAQDAEVADGPAVTEPAPENASGTGAAQAPARPAQGQQGAKNDAAQAEQQARAEEQARAQQQIDLLQQQLDTQVEENQHLQEVVGGLRGVQDRLDAAQAREQELAAQKAARLEALDRSAAMLGAASESMVYGNTDVGPLLDAAAGSLNGQAQQYAAQARAALDNGDLYNAGFFARAAEAQARLAQQAGTDTQANGP